jgi:general secretion pathway protein A
VYTDYFNLREPPFSIAPDPAYLFLSARHQEALGHLLYGTGQYGGFVQLTGEVGTGKTTVVRTLLAHKLQDVDVAMIHNPRQSEHEFVASICDELRARYPQQATLKALIDALNAHLLKAHAEGRRTVLIIDEAQNLEPGVLEQVRLLTNLETDKEKLLRILLVGQPELIELLARPDLRQLASRITARYHLLPFTPEETRDYIMHRLRVAGGSPDLFSATAIARVHQLARGVPRQINIICDRAMLGAYSEGQRQVTPQIVNRAAEEALGGAPLPHPSPGRRLLSALESIPLVWIEAAVACLALVLVGILLTRTLGSGAAAEAHTAEAQPKAELPAPVAALPAAAPPEQALPDPPPAAETNVAASPLVAPEDTLAELRRASEPLTTVMSRLIRQWNSDIEIPDGADICGTLAQSHLACYRNVGSWSDLRTFNRPAILSLNLGAGESANVLLDALGPDYAELEGADGRHRYPLAQLDNLWNGEYLLLWRNDFSSERVDPYTRSTDVLRLRRQLAQSEGTPLPAGASDRYDSQLLQEVKRYQAAHGLTPDGVAGVRTLIKLSDTTRIPGTPVLAAESSS